MSNDDEFFGPGRLRTLSFFGVGEREILDDLLDIGYGLSSSSTDELRAVARRF